MSFDIELFCKRVTEAEEAWTSNYDRNNPEDMYVREQLNRAVYQLESAVNEIKALSAPILTEGELQRNPNGRFSVNGHELTTGRSIEYLIHDDFIGAQTWRRGRIEHIHGDYAIYGEPEIELSGLRVRVKS